jgi:hypothetical protein
VPRIRDRRTCPREEDSRRHHANHRRLHLSPLCLPTTPPAPRSYRR